MHTHSYAGDREAPVRHQVAAGVLVRDGRVLLCHRRADRRWYPDVWDLVGGHLEAGETPRQALVRECREELGVEVHDVGDPQLVDLPEAKMWVFAVRSWCGEPTNAAPEEHDATGWFDPAALPTTGLADPRLAATIRQLVTNERHPEGE